MDGCGRWKRYKESRTSRSLVWAAEKMVVTFIKVGKTWKGTDLEDKNSVLDNFVSDTNSYPSRAVPRQLGKREKSVLEMKIW